MKTLILLLIPTILNSGDFCLEPKPFDNHIKVNVSVYNPSITQCDSTPLITASLKVIDTNLLKQNKLKWCAISHNLKQKYKYGDTLHIQGIGKLSGKYIIVDLMNKKYFNKVDILHYNRKYCREKGKIIL
jgi:3D (Asp-Asp-Asp) domain-containing protein